MEVIITELMTEHDINTYKVIKGALSMWHL